MGNIIGRPPTHGAVGTPTYKIWAAMRSRCNRPKHHAYKDYGGRGIKICERWNDFKNFLTDMGDKPFNKTIERINNDGDYEPGNCCWATRKEQMNNRRGNNIFVWQGKTQTLAQWAEEFGLSQDVLWQRLKNLKWSIEKALTTPTRHYGKRF